VGSWGGGIATTAPGGLRTQDDRLGEHSPRATRMKILDIPQSGRCGTFVSVRTRYGQVRCRRGVIRKAPSPDQLRHRALWRTLADAQRATWETDPEAVRSRSSLGQSGALPPYPVFVKVNVTRISQDLPPVLTRPQPHTFTANPVAGLVATNTGGVVDLKLSVPATPATDILVLGAAPCSAGVSFVNHYVILGRLPAPEGGYSSIRKLYIDRYGEPAAGRGSSFAHGKCATAGGISRSRPPPSSRRRSLSLGSIGANLGGPNAPSR